MANFLKIKQLAKERGISMTAIADNADVTLTGLGLIIKANKCTTDKLEKIAHFLNVPIGTFFDEAPKAGVNEYLVSYDAIEIIRKKDEEIAKKDARIAQLTDIIIKRQQ